MEALLVPALLGGLVVRKVRTRALFLALAVVVLIQVAEDEEAERAREDRRRRRRVAWWNAAMNKRAPVISHGDGTTRTRRHFGQASNYGRNLAPQTPLSPDEFYLHFRFAREDIPRLCRALRIPQYVRCPHTRCGCEGEEALLVYLKRMSYANRWVDLEFFFGRSRGGCKPSSTSCSTTCTSSRTTSRTRWT